MKVLRKFAWFAFAFVLVSLAVLSNIKLKQLSALPDDFVASYSDIDNVNNNALFGGFVHADMEKGMTKTGVGREDEGVIIFKLFNLIPIKKVNVRLLPEEEVYIGGNPIGLSLNTDGALVVSDTLVSTQSGKLSAHKSSNFKTGDVITKINGLKIENLNDINSALENAEDNVNIEYLRKNEIKTTNVKLLKDEEGQYKLGLWVRDDISGIGTLTYVDKNTHNFAALGHPVTDSTGGNILPISDGKIYDCSLLGITKGERNNPGELRCLYLQSEERGNIEKNTKFGIFGHVDDLEGIVDNNLTAKIGGRLGVSPGKAKIISSVSGIREEYEIEIIKANFQAKRNDKSIVFRVKDKRLLELTGGIVQGMSGSPIIQNGKIVGAVTHVFLNDPTKGYGVYTDWMK